MKVPSVSKAFVRQLKRQAAKQSRLTASQSLTSDEVASFFSVGHDSFLSSAAWKALRRKVIEHYGAKCMKCKHVPENRWQINVDHIKPRKFYPTLALEFSNLQVLCCACNKNKGNTDETDYRPLSTLG